jgi:hypothetical protein
VRNINGNKSVFFYFERMRERVIAVGPMADYGSLFLWVQPTADVYVGGWGTDVNARGRERCYSIRSGIGRPIVLRILVEQNQPKTRRTDQCKRGQIKLQI